MIGPNRVEIIVSKEEWNTLAKKDKEFIKEEIQRLQVQIRFEERRSSS